MIEVCWEMTPVQATETNGYTSGYTTVRDIYAVRRPGRALTAYGATLTEAIAALLNKEEENLGNDHDHH